MPIWGTLPTAITARATAIVQQGISLKTLYRHRELWHPEHQFSDQSKIPVCETAPLRLTLQKCHTFSPL